MVAASTGMTNDMPGIDTKEPTGQGRVDRGRTDLLVECHLEWLPGWICPIHRFGPRQKCAQRRDSCSQASDVSVQSRLKRPEATCDRSIGRNEQPNGEGRVGFEPTTRGLKVPCSNP